MQNKKQQQNEQQTNNKTNKSAESKNFRFFASIATTLKAELQSLQATSEVADLQESKCGVCKTTTATSTKCCKDNSKTCLQWLNFSLQQMLQRIAVIMQLFSLK